ncbi:unnamed protein product [Ilex paraguariensis]|uniref:Thioredoxin domain-containing protein n=1 Tax=Ilex paraguariensis TaxID=185542 RepID=A0ABC8R7K8_9AQUA
MFRFQYKTQVPLRCGPCKVMAPRFRELSEKYIDVVFLKLDCNKDNKPLAKELGIRVVPTFKILKDSKIVKEVTGAKFDDLVIAIESPLAKELGIRVVPTFKILKDSKIVKEVTGAKFDDLVIAIESVKCSQ